MNNNKQDEREEQSKETWSVIMGLCAVCVFILMFMASAGMIE